jgi:hypothetical protein
MYTCPPEVPLHLILCFDNSINWVKLSILFQVVAFDERAMELYAIAMSRYPRMDCDAMEIGI